MVQKIEYRQYGGSVLYYTGKHRQVINRRGFIALGRVGFGFLNNRASGIIEYEQANSTHLLYGVGLEYSRNGRIAARIEGHAFDKDVQYVQLSLLYRFGKNQQIRSKVKDSSASIDIIPESLSPLRAPSPEAISMGVSHACQQTETSLPIDKNGCPLFQGHQEGVTFISGLNLLEESSKRILDDIATDLNAYPQYRFLLSAHTDNIGPRNFNLQLSELRAEAVFT